MTAPSPSSHAGLFRGIHHHGLVVADLEQSVSFYTTQFGFREEFRVVGMGDQFQRTVGVADITCDLVQLWNERAGSRLELLSVHGVPPDLDPTLPVHVGVGHTAFLVSDISAAVAAVCFAGGRLLGEIVEFAEGPAAYLRSPGGTIFEIEEPTIQRETEHQP